MKCPACQQENRDDIKFCTHCGKPLLSPRSGTVIGSAASMQVPAGIAPAQTGGYLESSLVPGAPSVRYDLQAGETHIGRDRSKCQIWLSDHYVGRTHAKVHRNDSGLYVITDLGSCNGTFVNSQRIDSPKILRSGDLIQLGLSEQAKFTMKYESAAAGERTREYKGTVLDQTVDRRLRQLQLVVDQFVVQTFDLIRGRTITIGRDPQNTIVLEDATVSGKHAEITMTPDDHVTVSDLESTNGTFINGEAVRKQALTEGDRISFGLSRSRSLIYRDSGASEIALGAELLIPQGGTDKLTVGRDPQNDVALDHPVISKFHAVIERRDGEVWISDLGSRNGTFVNAKRIAEAALEDNDRIRLGPYELRFSQGQLKSQLELGAVQVDVLGMGKTVGDGKRILDDISLRIGKREFVGLIGPSGAGKSTFMDAINGFRPGTEGQVLYNSVDLYRSYENFRPIIGYVPQDDVLHAELTVFELLYYAARLRLPEDTSEVELRQRVLDAIATVELEDRRDTTIRALSGGQRKRVSLATEMLARPSILFLDEPTSGLDPMTEERMMELFRRVANRGCTVIITTHLLGSFSLFDKVVVLVQGKLAYYGPGTEFFSYFEENNPNEIYRKLAKDEPPEVWQNRFRASQQCARYCDEPLRALRQGGTARAGDATPPQPQKSGALRQLLTLTSRYARLKLGDKRNVAMLLLQAPVIAVLVYLICDAANSATALFMTIFAALWFGCSNSVREIVDETKIFRRERLTTLKIPSYVFSKILVLGGIALVQCIVFTSLLRGTNTIDSHYLWLTGVMFLVAVNGILIGLSLSASVSSPEKALMIFPLLVIPQLLLAGLIVPLGKVQTVFPISIDQALGERVTESVREGLTKGVRGLPLGESDKKQMSEFLVSTEPSVGIAILSYPMVARWAMEGLAHRYVHDEFQPASNGRPANYYQYKLYNSIYLLLHTSAEREVLLERLRQGASPGEAELKEKHDLAYLGILIGFAAVMTVLTLALVLRRAKKLV